MNDNKPDKPGKPEKDFTIIVNTREKTVSQEEITFAEIVALAYDNPPTGANVLFTVAYRRGHGNKPDGTMVETDPPLKLKEGMIFNVTATDKS
ncbi:MAG: hypothetical protein EAZ82_07765 [Verrucomicrobia bacterium]|nr:MAG: hypothetical protein EAZ82_07765 [Verrucomicrobiota bacterium]